MTFSTVRELIETLQKYYKDDDKLLAYWWDAESISFYVEDICVSEDRTKEIWENAGEYADDRNDHGLESISETINDAIYDQITKEEREHYGCIEVIVDGKVVHKEQQELSDKSLAEVVE